MESLPAPNNRPKALAASAGELLDEHGLNIIQREFLTVRAACITDYEALQALKLSTLWLTAQLRVSEFRKMYNLLFPVDPKALTKNSLATLLPKGVEVLQAMLEDDENPKGQRWAIDRLLRVAGLDKIQVETKTVEVPFDVAIALQMRERGATVPPKMLQKLKDGGYLNEDED